jgi:adenosylhomocysteine nucleosidase
MHDVAVDDPCILFALGRESAAFRRVFRPQQRFPGAPCRARFCGPEWLSVLVLETGIGPERAGRALSWLFDSPRLEQLPYRPKVVISAGFCGGLQEDRAVGDIILAEEVVDADGHGWPTTWPGELPAGEWRPPLHRGRLLSVPRIIGTAEEKQALGRKHQALAVDMESATIARWCQKHDVPFGCVRAVSDDARTSLSPLLLDLFQRDSLSQWLTTLARSPRLMGELWQLARATRRAAGQLQQALGELLTLTLSWGKEL